MPDTPQSEADLSITPADLKAQLNRFSFQGEGDPYEKGFGRIIAATLPRAEAFWKLVVVPHTQRIEKQPEDPIRPRAGVHNDIKRLSNLHYSLFLNLAYCHHHVEGLEEGRLQCHIEDFYAHIGSACDLVEAILELAYVLLLASRGEPCEFSETLTRDQWLRVAGEWYDKDYGRFHEHYVRGGRVASWRVPARSSIAHEFVEGFLNSPGEWKAYARLTQNLRTLRNLIVHNTQIGKLIIGGRVFIPKAEASSRYPTWEDVFAALDDPQQVKRDFGIVPEQLSEDLRSLELTVNDIWRPLIEAFANELFNETRGGLRQMYRIKFLA
jgi:hypothetical protein